MADKIDTLTANGQSTRITCVGPVHLHLSGGFGGGTAKLTRYDAAADSMVDVVDASFTAAGETVFDYPPRATNQFEVDLSGATTPTLKVWLQSSP